MWLKIAGAILVMTAGTLFGFWMSNRYIERTRQLRQFNAFLQALEMQIAYRQTPLAEAFRRSALTVTGIVAELFARTGKNMEERSQQPLAAALTQARQEVGEELAFQTVELEVLDYMSECLGRSDCEDQVKQLHLMQHRLQEALADATARQTNNVKMWRSLGIYGGLAAVILLV